MGLYAHFNSALFGLNFLKCEIKIFWSFFTIFASPVINFTAILRANAEFFQYLRSESLLEMPCEEAQRDS